MIMTCSTSVNMVYTTSSRELDIRSCQRERMMYVPAMIIHNHAVSSCTYQRAHPSIVSAELKLSCEHAQNFTGNLAFHLQDDDPNSLGGFTTVSVRMEAVSITFYDHKGTYYC